MIDKKPILLATDGSPSATEAQRKAIELARTLRAPLIVLSVANVALPAYGYTAYGYTALLAELTEEEHKRMNELLASVRKRPSPTGCRAPRSP